MAAVERVRQGLGRRSVHERQALGERRRQQHLQTDANQRESQVAGAPVGPLMVITTRI